MAQQPYIWGVGKYSPFLFLAHALVRGRECNVQKGLEPIYSLGSRPFRYKQRSGAQTRALLYCMMYNTHTCARAHTGDYLELLASFAQPSHLVYEHSPHVPGPALLVKQQHHPQDRDGGVAKRNTTRDVIT